MFLQANRDILASLLKGTCFHCFTEVQLRLEGTTNQTTKPSQNFAEMNTHYLATVLNIFFQLPNKYEDYRAAVYCVKIVFKLYE